MNLQTFRLRVKNIEKTHPAPSGADFFEANQHFRRIIENWKLKLNKADKAEIDLEDKRFADRMQF